MATSTHPFEKAGLGYAPFRCIGVRENAFEMPDHTFKAGGCCDYCGTGIRWEYLIKGANDGRVFKVGCDCVEKTGWNVEDFEKTRLQLARDRRAVKSEVRRAARQLQWDEERKLRDAARKEASASWMVEHAVIVAKLTEYNGTNPFIMDMFQEIRHDRMLTTRQLEAVESAFAVIERQQQALANSKYVGEVGQRIKNANVRVTRSLCVGWNRFGYTNTPRVLVTLETESGDQLTWWTNHHETPFEIFEPAAFTVKEHSEYKGVKQTNVQRVAFK